MWWKDGDMDASLLKNRDVLERVAIVLLVAAVAAVYFAVLRPFLSSILWAGILVFSSWPVYRWVRVKVVGNSAVSAAALSPGRDALLRVLSGKERARSAPQSMASSLLPPRRGCRSWCRNGVKSMETSMFSVISKVFRTDRPRPPVGR